VSGVGPRYRILRRIGQGGMAEVFEAELVGDLGFVRKVAIKRMLATAAAEPAAARRFLDEARIASRLHHAHIVAVVELGLLDGLPFQVLEFVDGSDAQELLQRAGGVLPLEVALAITGDVAHALDHAHGALDDAGLPLHIVHRDVKPSNVLVSWAGDVKLGDFGIAVARDRTAITEAGVLGTRGFLAPEQHMRGQLDGRTDVFALGLTLHALLTGTTPLADPAVELRVLAGDSVPLDPAIPDDVRAVIARAVAPVRAERPSAGEFAEAIGAVLAPRLVSDPRSLVRAFLAGLAPQRTRAGALDALLGIDVVLDHADGEVRRFATVHHATAPTVASPPARRRARWLAVPALAALTGGGLLLARYGSHDAPTPVTSDASTPLAAALDAAPARVDAAAADAAVVVSVPPVDAARPRTRRHDDAPATPVGTGYLVVTGEELIGAAVVVDGVTAGYVPNLIEVAQGRHRVDVVRRDGSRLGVRDVEVTSFHTRNRPAHPSW
jgi:tRNA A-37 threonylcarbamoyl transferase component Bud32